MKNDIKYKNTHWYKIPMNINHHLDTNGNFYLEHEDKMYQVVIDRNNNIELDPGEYKLALDDIHFTPFTEEERFEFLRDDEVHNREDGDFLALYTTTIYRDNIIQQESRMDSCMYSLYYYTETNTLRLTPYGVASKHFRLVKKDDQLVAVSKNDK